MTIPADLSAASPIRLPWWTLGFPALALVAVALGLAKLGTVGTVAAAVVLIGAVLAAVHHAEVVAHRVGEPFGTLVLAIAVTVIEVSLIVSLMLPDSGDASTLARDTVFAAIMIIVNGIVGLCLLAGGLKHREQRFSLRGVSAALNVLVAMAVLTLVLPNYVESARGRRGSKMFSYFMGFLRQSIFPLNRAAHFVRSERKAPLRSAAPRLNGVADAR